MQYISKPSCRFSFAWVCNFVLQELVAYLDTGADLEGSLSICQPSIVCAVCLCVSGHADVSNGLKMPCGSSTSSLSCLAMLLGASLPWFTQGTSSLLGTSCDTDMLNSLYQLVRGPVDTHTQQHCCSWVQSDTYLLLQHLTHWWCQ